jgi:hypothetical protein
LNDPFPVTPLDDEHDLIDASQRGVQAAGGDLVERHADGIIMVSHCA